MIRFIMPNFELDKVSRIKELNKQVEAFMECTALKALLDKLDTDIDCIAEQYNARVQKGGKVIETQEIVSIPELAKRRDELYPLFDELGFFKINRPVSTKYTRILILSASLKSRQKSYLLMHFHASDRLTLSNA